MNGLVRVRLSDGAVVVWNPKTREWEPVDERGGGGRPPGDLRFGGKVGENPGRPPEPVVAGNGGDE